MSVDFLCKAYVGLLEREPIYELKVRYSKAFEPYNANVKYTRREMVFSLSHLWKDTSVEIKIGLIQFLLSKVFKTKRKTLNMDLYEIFLKNVHIGIEKDKIDPLLKSVFDKMNDMYFAGMLDMPNLVWGGRNLSKLGSYTYSSDTIMISDVLRKDSMLLEYVMYHEMLHKKLKFNRSKTGTKTFHHTKEFKELEAKFYDKDAEQKLKIFLRKQKLKRAFFLD
ncbi:hypothetical protein C0585_03180 [Candidatus Woesearchaeota archaeon]|nr:MAG: hypothetical protein C0585_03180 [Candidatus Woesearchaeota archaeon]